MRKGRLQACFKQLNFYYEDLGMWVEASVGHEGQIIVKQVDSGESSPATGRRKFYVSEKSKKRNKKSHQSCTANKFSL